MKCAKEKKEGQLIRSTSVLVPLNKKRTSSQLSSEKENCLAADIGCYVLFEVISRCFERKGNPNGAASSEFSSSQIKDGQSCYPDDQWRSTLRFDLSHFQTPSCCRFLL